MNGWLVAAAATGLTAFVAYYIVLFVKDLRKVRQEEDAEGL